MAVIERALDLAMSPREARWILLDMTAHTRT
jgi:hypothetical protein